MAAAAMLEIDLRAIKWAIKLPPDLVQIGTRLRKACRVQKLQNQRRSPSFKMTAAAILFIEMNAIKWAITTRS
jgi:hypothetical protein